MERLELGGLDVNKNMIFNRKGVKRTYETTETKKKNIPPIMRPSLHVTKNSNGFGAQYQVGKTDPPTRNPKHLFYRTHNSSKHRILWFQLFGTTTRPNPNQAPLRLGFPRIEGTEVYTPERRSSDEVKNIRHQPSSTSPRPSMGLEITIPLPSKDQSNFGAGCVYRLTMALP